MRAIGGNGGCAMADGNSRQQQETGGDQRRPNQTDDDGETTVPIHRMLAPGALPLGTGAGTHSRSSRSKNKSAAAAANRRGQCRPGLRCQERQTQAEIAARRRSRANRRATGHHKETMPRAGIRPAAGRASPVRLLPACNSIRERGMERLGAAGRMSRAHRRNAFPLPIASAVFARQKAGPPWVRVTYRPTPQFFNGNLWRGSRFGPAATVCMWRGRNPRSQAARFERALFKSAGPNEV